MSVKVSIIVATYNYGRFLARALESVFSQDYPSKKREIIVVDRNSSDNTKDILNSYINRSNIFVLQQPGKGLANAVNYGIAHARGRYILRLDADDFLYQGIVFKESEILDNNPNVDFVYPDYNYFLEKENKRIRKILPEFSKEEIIQRGDFLSGGTMFRRAVFEKYRGYDETIPALDSYELFLRIVLKGAVGYHLPEALFEYTIHGASLSDDIDLIEQTGPKICSRYGIPYQKNENHPRNIPEH